MNGASSKKFRKRSVPNKLATVPTYLKRETLEGVVQGELTLSQAAEILGVSNSTICWHVKQIKQIRTQESKALLHRISLLEESRTSPDETFPGDSPVDICLPANRMFPEAEPIQPMETPIDHDYIVSYRFGLNKVLKEDGALIVDVGEAKVRYYTVSSCHTLHDGRGTVVQYFICTRCSRIQRADGDTTIQVPRITVVEGHPVGELLPQHYEECLPIPRLNSMAQQIDRAARLAIQAGSTPVEAWHEGIEKCYQEAAKLGLPLQGSGSLPALFPAKHAVLRSYRRIKYNHTKRLHYFQQNMACLEAAHQIQPHEATFSDSSVTL